jgi:hypothetical protein
VHLSLEIRMFLSCLNPSEGHSRDNIKRDVQQLQDCIVRHLGAGGGLTEIHCGIEMPTEHPTDEIKPSM